jgi:hypothetical protein
MARLLLGHDSLAINLIYFDVQKRGEKKEKFGKCLQK